MQVVSVPVILAVGNTVIVTAEASDVLSHPVSVFVTLTV